MTARIALGICSQKCWRSTLTKGFHQKKSSKNCNPSKSRCSCFLVKSNELEIKLVFLCYIEKKEKEFRKLFKEKYLDQNQIKFLIQNGIDVKGKDDGGRNALHILCINNSSEKIIDGMQFLIQNGIDVNGKDNNGKNALHFLCWNNSSEKLIDAVQLLLENGINVNEKSNDGWNALHFLCWNNLSEKLIDAMQFLIENGIDVNEKSNGGWNALHFLCWNNLSEKLIDAIQLLKEHGIQSNGIDARSLLYRNKTETIEEIIHLLDRTAVAN